MPFVHIPRCAGMVSGKQLVAEMDLKRAEERKRFAKLEVTFNPGCLSKSIDPSCALEKTELMLSVQNLVGNDLGKVILHM